MKSEDIQQIISLGEGVHVEFKRGGKGARDDVFETYCSFLNRDGGDILLGVGDDGSIIGLPTLAIKDIVNNLVCVMNDGNLLNPPFCVLPEVLDYDGQKIIKISVPQSSDVHRYKGVCYDRINESDVKVTSSDQIAQMYIRKRNIYTEQALLPEVTIDDIRGDLFPRIRQMACAFRPEHPWKELPDIELLKSARLYVYDASRNCYCFNAAAVLLLGNDEVIRRFFPAYKTDALLQTVNTDRYDDRCTIMTNLIESYDQLFAFGQKWLPDKFYLENGFTVSLRDRILREAVGNLIIHREYTSSRPGRLIIRTGELVTDNANKALQPGVITLHNLCPRPKNPIIADFFQIIGRADELGSGVRNLYKYVRLYSGKSPVFDEEDVFTLTIPLDRDYNPDAVLPISTKKHVKVATKGKNSFEMQAAILDAIRGNPKVSSRIIAATLDGISAAQVKTQMSKMQREGLIVRVGPSGHGGSWVIKR